MRKNIAFICSFLCIQAVHADRLPEWEAGVALGYVSIPFYRGSSSGREKILPLPLVIVRPKVKARDRWIRVGAHQVGLDLSFGANLPIPGGDRVLVRSGMPALDATIELGPRVSLKLWQRSGHRASVALPLRVMSSISFSGASLQGWMASPYLSYEYLQKGKKAWKLEALIGPSYGSRGYHQYYYGVERKYATENRPYFDAKQGYSGSRAMLYAHKTYKNLWLSAFARVDVLNRSSFEKSALVERRATWIGGFVVGWVFKKSPHLVGSWD